MGSPLQMNMFGPSGGTKSAVLSSCERYRYELARSWAAENTRVLLFVMLNPSTADAQNDDATVRTIVGFAKRWGYTGLRVANLFAYRATRPEALLEAKAAGVDVIGPETDARIRALAASSSAVVCAWGAHAAKIDPTRAQAVYRIVRAERFTISCFGQNADGSPMHPLYKRADTVPVAYFGPGP